MVLSQSLGYLALLAFLAMWGKAIWRTRQMSRNRWYFGNHDFDNLPEVLRTVLKRCLNGGSVVIEDRRTGQFVQFRKYILAKGDYGLELGFPDAPWSRAFFPKLRDALTAKGIRFRETGRSAGDITNFLHVDCGKDIAKAVEISRLCFFDIFILARDTRFKSTISDYGSLDELVDDPNFKDHGLKWWSVWRAREQAEGRPDPALMLRAAFWTVAVQVAFVVLWTSWFLQSGAQPDWRFSLGALHVAGGEWTLIFLITFGFVSAFYRLTAGKVMTLIKSMPKTKTVAEKAVAWIFIVALPAAVIMSWLGH